jgi:hypothetical protein
MRATRPLRKNDNNLLDGITEIILTYVIGSES